MATGFSNAAEKAILDNVTVGLERQLYLYLFKYDGYRTGATGTGNGDKVTMNDDGTITSYASGATITISGGTAIADSANGFTAAMNGMVIDALDGSIPVGCTFTYISAGSGTLSLTSTNGSGKTVKINAFSVVTGGGWVPVSVLGNATPGAGDWAAASAGAPTTKNLQVTKSFLATGSGLGDVCWWALSTLTPAAFVTAGSNQAGWAANAALMVNHGPITTSGGVQTVVPVATSETFQFDSSNPIKVQLGDPSDTFG